MTRSILIIFLVIFLVLGVKTFIDYTQWRQNAQAINRAISAPLEGEEKNQTLNEALKVLLNSADTSADVQAAKGSLLAEFQEFPLAFYYLRQALLLKPNSQNFQEQLEGVVSQGNLPQPPPLRKEAFFLGLLKYFFMFISLIFLILAINFPRPFYYVAFCLAFLPLFIEGAYAFRSYFLLPIEGVAIKPLQLYYEPTQEKGVRWIEGGEVVEVLEANRSTLKIRTRQHELGYVNSASIRLFR